MSNFTLPKLNRKKVIYLSFIAVLIYIAAVYRTTISEIIKPFAIAAIVSYLMNPIVEVFERRGIKRILAVFIVYFAFIATIIIFGFVLIPTLIHDIGILVENLPEFSKNIQNIFDEFQDGNLYNNLPDTIKDIIDENLYLLQSIVVSALQKVADSIIAMLSQLFNIVLIPVIIFYMLKDTSYFKNQLILLIPKSSRTKAMLLFRDIDNAFGRYIRGQIIIASFVGIMTTSALLIIEVKYAVVLGLFAGISNVIPYFGPVIGLVPTVLFAFFDSPSKALYATGAFLFIQQIESGILTPKIIGESTGIHPVYVIMALIIGGNVLGVAGLILAVPALVAIKLTMRHLLRNSD